MTKLKEAVVEWVSARIACLSTLPGERPNVNRLAKAEFNLADEAKNIINYIPLSTPPKE